MERNLATGDEQQISQRGQDFNLRSAEQAQRDLSGGDNARQTGSARETGSVRQSITEARRDRSGQTRQQQPSAQEMVPEYSESADDIRQSGVSHGSTQTTTYQSAEAPGAPGASPSYEGSQPDASRPPEQYFQHEARSGAVQEAQHISRRDATYHQTGTVNKRLAEDPAQPSEQSLYNELRETASADKPDESLPVSDSRNADSHLKPGKTTPSERAGHLHYDNARQTTSGAKPKQRGTKYQRQFSEDAVNSEAGASVPTTPKSAPAPDRTVPTDSSNSGSRTKTTERAERLHFNESKPPPSGSKLKQRGTKYQQRFSEDAVNTEAGASAPKNTPAPDRTVPTDSSDSGSRTKTTERAERLRFNESNPPPSGSKPKQRGTKYQQRLSKDAVNTEAGASAPKNTPAPDRTVPTDSSDSGSKTKPTERAGRLRFDESKPPPSGSKPKQRGTKYQRRFSEGTDGEASSQSEDSKPDSQHSADSRNDSRAGGDGGRSSGSEPSSKKSKLEFAGDELPPDKRLEKTQYKAEKSAAKLEKAKEKLPTKRKMRLIKEFDAETGKPKRRLHFEKEVKTQSQHLKGPLPLRPVKAGANAGIGYVHKKIHQVEHENVGVEAAHKGALVVEGTLRKGWRLHKTRPYRRVAKLQRKATKRAIKLSYQQALHDNPKLKSNLLSRMMQKRKIKQQYAKAAREAKRAGKAAQKAGSFTAKLARAVTGFIRRHPVVFGIIALLLLLMMLIMGFFSSCSNMAAGGLSSILASSYLAEDEDIDNAELFYTELETDLQIQINNAESTYGGYDEYRYNVDDISHNPFELMAFLTSVYQDFTYSEIQAVLQEIFNEQYQLTFVEEIEVRYRTETYYDPETGESYDVEVPYNWYILNINLTARSFTDVIAARMDSSQREVYSLLMTTKGNRQYLANPFDFNWLSYISSYYGWRIHPITGEKNYHKGIDIAVASGTEIMAGHDGTVTFAGNSGDYGLVVVLDDGKGLVSKYAHCSELLVSAGQEVKQGDVIAKVGNTGNSTGPHLHLEIIKDGQYLNPAYFADTGDDGSGSILPGQPGGVEFPDYPGEPMGDGAFAALMEEAQKHLGKPYVFGASGPNSFDCSGFVCYVLNNSGVASVGRTTAQGLYNMSTPVSAADAQPGDLIFFHSTYSTSDTVTHIGIYIGNGMMIHAGNPVQYASIDSTYWQNHFYAFGRIS